MEEMKFMCMYKDYLDVFRDLTDVRRGRLILAVLEYAFRGTETELRGEERMAFTMIRSQIDRDREKYTETCKKRREQGAKGGRPKKPKGFENNLMVFEKPIEKENEKENENEKVKEKEKENEKEKAKESVSVYGSAPEVPVRGHTHTQLCLPDIKKYCLEQGLTSVDPERFYDYYQSVGWMSGSHRITDWKAALRSWNREDAAKAAVKKQEEDRYAIYDECF